MVFNMHSQTCQLARIQAGSSLTMPSLPGAGPVFRAGLIALGPVHQPQRSTASNADSAVLCLLAMECSPAMHTQFFEDVHFGFRDLTQAWVALVLTAACIGPCHLRTVTISILVQAVVDQEHDLCGCCAYFCRIMHSLQPLSQRPPSQLPHKNRACYSTAAGGIHIACSCDT